MVDPMYNRQEKSLITPSNGWLQGSHQGNSHAMKAVLCWTHLELAVSISLYNATRIGHGLPSSPPDNHEAFPSCLIHTPLHSDGPDLIKVATIRLYYPITGPSVAASSPLGQRNGGNRS